MIDEKQEKLTEMVDGFCDEYLNEEYKQSSEDIIEMMADERSVPFKRGKLEVWASAVIYVVCQVNSLFDDSNDIHINRKDIFKYFKTNQSTVSLKANNLRNRFDLDNEIPITSVEEFDFTDFDDLELGSEEEHYLNMMDNIFEGNNPVLDDGITTIEGYQKAINDYRKQFGEEFFKEHEGHFWLIKETRPFMQCLFEQAQLFWENGEKIKAINQYKYMLKLNPNDNQGVRNSLFPNLLELNRIDEAQELYLQYEDEYSANWKFCKLLLDIKINASFDEIKMQYDECVEYNPFVIPYLIGNKKLPSEMPYFYGFGDENEAIFYVMLASDAWNKDKHALKMLKKLAKN